MKKGIIVLVVPVLLSGCAVSRPQMDYSKYKDAVSIYGECLAIEAEPYFSMKAEPIDIADAAAAKCEKGIVLAKNAIREEADKNFTQGSSAWVEMMKLAEEKGVALREKGTRATIARVLDARKQSTAQTPLSSSK